VLHDLLGLLHVSQRALPNAAPIRRRPSGWRIDLLELALGEGRLVAQALELLSARALGAGLRLLVGTDCAGIGIEFDRRERGEEGLNHFRVHGSSRDILADGDPVVLAELVAKIVRPALVLHHQLMPTGPRSTPGPVPGRRLAAECRESSCGRIRRSCPAARPESVRRSPRI